MTQNNIPPVAARDLIKAHGADALRVCLNQVEIFRMCRMVSLWAEWQDLAEAVAELLQYRVEDRTVN